MKHLNVLKKKRFIYILAVLSLHYCAQGFSIVAEWGLLFVVV